MQIELGPPTVLEGPPRPPLPNLFCGDGGDGGGGGDQLCNFCICNANFRKWLLKESCWKLLEETKEERRMKKKKKKKSVRIPKNP